MSPRLYDALIFDLDGTLLTDEGVPHPRTFEAITRARAQGALVMLATGRSEGGTLEVLELLGIDLPAVVYNGAGLYCPLEARMIEERVLAETVVTTVLDAAECCGWLPVVMRTGVKYAPVPATADEQEAMHLLEDLVHCERTELPTHEIMRITLFAGSVADSAVFQDQVAAVLGDRPIYLTHFPLSCLPAHRTNPLFVVDVQPPCRGKGEALRYLQDTHGIGPERVVAVGDAGNDVPMLERAGLSVAMQNATQEVLSIADRVIGHNNAASIADLVDELFA